jgi:hypothetical protein
MSFCGNKGKKKTTFNPDVPPFKWSDVPDDNTGIGSLATPSTSKRARSDTTSCPPAYKPESDPLTYGKTRLQKESPKEPGASRKDLITTFANFLADIHKDYTRRFHTLTAHIVTLLEAHREATSGHTQLAGQLSTFSADVYEDFCTKDDYHHHLTSLENDISSVQERFSSPEWWERSAPPEPPRDKTTKCTF